MKFGIQVNVYGVTWDEIARSINAMEAGPWHSLWFADHFFPPWGGPKGQRESEHREAFEGYTMAAVAAGMTSKLRLGHLVLGNTYRNPALLAKMATSLDQASKGRFHPVSGRRLVRARALRLRVEVSRPCANARIASRRRAS